MARYAVALALPCIVLVVHMRSVYNHHFHGCYHPAQNPFFASADLMQVWKTLAASDLVPMTLFESKNDLNAMFDNLESIRYTDVIKTEVLRDTPLWIYITLCPSIDLSQREFYAGEKRTHDSHCHEASHAGLVRLEAGLKAHGLRPGAARAMRAVTPDDFVHNMRLPTKVTVETEVAGGTGALMLSHLKAMKEAWESKKEWVIISEDDVSFDYINGQPASSRLLLDVVAELATKHPHWSICMLGYTLCDCKEALSS
jgi:hypothetical protein